MFTSDQPASTSNVYADELKRRDDEMGLVRRHVWWGPEGEMMSDDEKARVLLCVQWQMERGHCPVINNLDRWTIGDAFRCFVANLCRVRDFVFFIRNPYQS